MNKEYFKDEEVYNGYYKLHPKLQEIMGLVFIWCENRNIKPVVTATMSDADNDERLGRVSASHQQGRAFDLRSRDWDRDLIPVFIDHFSSLYGHLGAVGLKTGLPRLIVFHDVGHGEHFHIQLNTTFNVGIKDKT